MLAISLENDGRLEKLADEITNVMNGKIVCLKSNNYLLEIFASNAGKGNAVKELCSKLGIPVQNSYAAGDEQNDISMLEAAHVGIAMLNAREIVKENSDIITESDNNNDGLLPFFTN